MTLLTLRALVYTSNVIVDKELKSPAVAEVEEVFEPFVGKLMAAVIGLEKGLEMPLRLFGHSKSRNLKLVHLRNVDIKSRFQKNHQTQRNFSHRSL